jgi:ADP-ribose pyrophosphatase YjhB (NUDIX family)
VAEDHISYGIEDRKKELGSNQQNPQYRFCPECGGQLKKREIKENEPPRPVCRDCGFVLYLDPKVVACTIVRHEGKIVLLRRGINPQKGKWVMPGGYVDRGEKVEHAALRETKEECGLDIEIVDLHGLYSYPGYVPVVVVYLARCLSGNLSPRDETLEARWFAENEIPWEELAFQSTVDAIKDLYRT